MFDLDPQLPSYVLYAPIYLSRTYDKNWSLNLNEYRNTHYQTLNKMKIKFKEFMEDQIIALPKFNTIQLTYRLFFGSERDIDTNNVCAVVDKFLCDAMKELGCIDDDNRRILTDTRFTFGGVDKHNPRCEVHITGELKEMEPMKLVFTPDEQAEIVHQYVKNDKELVTRAMEAFVKSKGLLGENQRVDVHVVAAETTVRIIDKAKDILPAVAASKSPSVRVQPTVTAAQVEAVLKDNADLDRRHAKAQLPEGREALTPLVKPVTTSQTTTPDLTALSTSQPVEAIPEPVTVTETSASAPKVGLFAGLKPKASQDQAPVQPETVAEETPKDPARSLFAAVKPAS